MGRPVILLGFANDKEDFLEYLQEERDGIEDALWNQISEGVIEIQGQVGMTIDKVFSYFKSDHYKERIKVFHFGGHADSQVWRLADNQATVAGMAPFFENLDLVVLNGCATQKQADEFLKYGVKAVIASRSEIPDRESKIFAIEFYKNLSGGKTLEFAFETALQKIHTTLGRPVKNKRGLTWNKDASHVEEIEPKVFWELIVAKDEMKHWTLAEAGHFDLSYLQIEKEERERKDLEFRLMRFGSFEDCRKHMAKKLKGTNEVPAAALIVSGKQDNGQKWVAGNLLRDVVPFLGDNINPPLNITFGTETSNDPKYFWQEAREWIGGNRDAVESNLRQETKFLAIRLVPLLQTQPVIFRIYNTLEQASFATILSSVIDNFWKPFLLGLSGFMKANPELNFYPFVLLIIDESKELDLNQFHSDELKIKSLPKNPPVTKDVIEKWIKWETENPVISARVISPIIKAMTNDLTAVEYYTGDNDSSIVGIFLKKICDDLQFKVEDNFSDENRLIHLAKNKVTPVSPDLSLTDYFS